MTLNQIFGFDFEKKLRTKLTNFSKNQNFLLYIRTKFFSANRKSAAAPGQPHRGKRQLFSVRETEME